MRGFIKRVISPNVPTRAKVRPATPFSVKIFSKKWNSIE